MSLDEPIPVELLAEIERQKQDYRKKLPERMKAIEAALDAMEQGGKEEAAEARRIVHSLAGSAETFGLDGVGKAARNLLDLLDSMIDADDRAATHAAAIRFLFSTLRAEAAAVCGPPG